MVLWNDYIGEPSDGAVLTIYTDYDSRSSFRENILTLTTKIRFTYFRLLFMEKSRDSPAHCMIGGARVQTLFWKSAVNAGAVSHPNARAYSVCVKIFGECFE